MSSEYPLVSAIMPTRGRREMARTALDCFHAQTWPNREIVILDDEQEPSFPLLKVTDGFARYGAITYQRLAIRRTVGVKRNLAISQAHGDIICHFDSDDYSAPGRIEEQVYRLMQADIDIVGYNSMLFRKDDEWWLYQSDRKNYAIGTSMMYTREYWQRKSFADTNVGEDFLFQAGARIHAIPAGDLMWARIHPGNTSPKNNVMHLSEWRRVDQPIECNFAIQEAASCA